MLAKLGLYFHTLKYLKPGQIGWRIYYRLRRLKPVAVVPHHWRSPQSDNPDANDPSCWQQNAWRNRSYFGAGTFELLHQKLNINHGSGWNARNVEKLWLYNLHYLDDLLATDSGERLLQQQELVQRWQDDNPQPHGNGWEPYPLSLRIVNLLSWQLNHPGVLSAEAQQSLACQTEALFQQLEYHILGNHLLANAKALVFAGVCLQGPFSQRWLDKGLQLLNEQLPEQVLADGGHFELSPMYHGIMLMDVLDLLNLARAYQGRISAPVQQSWQEVAQQMLGFYLNLCHPDGFPAFFNDSAINIAPAYPQILAYAKRLGIEEPQSATEATTSLLYPDSGYVVHQQSGFKLLLDIADVGPDYLPGHAHADTLSVELSLAGQRILVNSGTSEYGTGAERQRQRSTAAHNTVVVNDDNSSQIWGGFRVAKRARVLDLEYQADAQGLSVAASHDGYQRIYGGPIHRRSVEVKGSTVVIRDALLGEFAEAEGSLPLAEGSSPKVKGSLPLAEGSLSKAEGSFPSAKGFWHLHPKVEACLQGQEVLLLVEDKALAKMTVQGADIRIEASTYHPEFGLKQHNQCLCLDFVEKEISISLEIV